LMMGPVGFLETLVWNYHSVLCNIPEDADLASKFHWNQIQ